jgi:NDP-sugar pyrophosphorylase family protein
MRPRTETLPKSLLPVAGRPFVDWQLDWLAANGVAEVVLSIGHLGAMIAGHVDDGSDWGMRVSYVWEHDHLLGTGGALRLAAEVGALAPSCLVLYGDSYLTIDLDPVVQAFASSQAPALMTVWRNDGLYEASNVELRQNRLVWYDKHRPDPSTMHHIDYGLSAIDTRVVVEEIPRSRPHDLADVLAGLSRSGRVVGLEVPTRFYEIGSERGLRELEHHLRQGARR